MGYLLKETLALTGTTVGATTVTSTGRYNGTLVALFYNASTALPIKSTETLTITAGDFPLLTIGPPAADTWYSLQLDAITTTGGAFSNTTSNALGVPSGMGYPIAGETITATVTQSTGSVTGAITIFVDGFQF